MDCLNCEKGCNGGTATRFQELSLDDLEAPVERRNQEMRFRHRKSGPLGAARSRAALAKLVLNYWRPGLYGRAYQDRSADQRFRLPSEQELQGVEANTSRVAQASAQAEQTIEITHATEQITKAAKTRAADQG